MKTDRAPAAIGPYSQAVRANGLLFISGQIPMDPHSSEIVAGEFEDRVRRVLDNVEAILEAAGTSWASVVKVTVYLTDMDRFQEFNSIYAQRFASPAPARAVVEVSALPRGVDVEIEAVASMSG